MINHDGPALALFIKRRCVWPLFWRVGLIVGSHEWTIRPLRWPFVYLWAWADNRVDRWHEERTPSVRTKPQPNAAP